MDINVAFAPEHQGKPKAELDALVEGELDRFSSYMAGLSGSHEKGPLTPFERMLVKTYLVYRLKETV